MDRVEADDLHRPVVGMPHCHMSLADVRNVLPMTTRNRCADGGVVLGVIAINLDISALANMQWQPLSNQGVDIPELVADFDGLSLRLVTNLNGVS